MFFREKPQKFQKKNVATKLEGGGEKALVAGPLRNNFFAASLSHYLREKNGIQIRLLKKCLIWIWFLPHFYLLINIHHLLFLTTIYYKSIYLILHYNFGKKIQQIRGISNFVQTRFGSDQKTLIRIRNLGIYCGVKVRWSSLWRFMCISFWDRSPGLQHWGPRTAILKTLYKLLTMPD